MKKGTVWKRVGDFVVGKGFYIVLFLCVATIGISGYYLVSAFSGGKTPDQSVVGGAHVVIPDGDEPSSPTVTPPPSQPAVTPSPDSSRPVSGGDDLESDHGTAPSAPSQPEPAPQPEPEKPAVSTPPVYTWPVKGEIISAFSLEVLAYDETMDDWRTHSGVDIAAPAGTRVMAMSSGTVQRVYEDDLMGTAVVIDHGDGLISSYYNLSPKPTVSEGDQVVTGTVIGAVGETALAEISRPPHLHLEVSLNGKSTDPTGYLPKY